jgi:hypothetical protein
MRTKEEVAKLSELDPELAEVGIDRSFAMDNMLNKFSFSRTTPSQRVTGPISSSSV